MELHNSPADVFMFKTPRFEHRISNFQNSASKLRALAIGHSRPAHRFALLVLAHLEGKLGLFLLVSENF